MTRYVCEDCEDEFPCTINNPIGSRKPTYCPYDGEKCEWRLDK